MYSKSFPYLRCQRYAGCAASHRAIVVGALGRCRRRGRHSTCGAPTRRSRRQNAREGNCGRAVLVERHCGWHSGDVACTMVLVSFEDADLLCRTVTVPLPSCRRPAGRPCMKIGVFVNVLCGADQIHQGAPYRAARRQDACSRAHRSAAASLLRGSYFIWAGKITRRHRHPYGDVARRRSHAMPCNARSSGRRGCESRGFGEPSLGASEWPTDLSGSIRESLPSEIGTHAPRMPTRALTEAAWPVLIGSGEFRIV